MPTTARQVRDHFMSVGAWVNWEKTCDLFLFGDPDTEIRGVAVAWTATNKALRTASQMGANLFITHEPIFYDRYEGSESRESLVESKKALLGDAGLTVLRCHDTWDRMPVVGIPDAWAAYLGFETEPRQTESFYKVCHVGGQTVRETASHILERVRPLGQDAVLIFGDQDRRAERMVVGTGAITHLPRMYELGADLILATDDGMNFWDGGLWAKDLDIPILIVNHATSEKPGMMAMATYLAEKFPGIPVDYVDVDFPYTTVTT